MSIQRVINQTLSLGALISTAKMYQPQADDVKPIEKSVKKSEQSLKKRGAEIKSGRKVITTKEALMWKLSEDKGFAKKMTNTLTQREQRKLRDELRAVRNDK